MKRNLLIIAAILIGSNVFAQKTSFGITAGTSIANYKYGDGGVSVSASDKAGLTAGVIADIPLGSGLSFQPGLHFVQKGTKSEESFGGMTEKYELRANCIELPLNVLYNVSAGTGKFFIGAGPGFGLNISGKTKYDDGNNSEKLNLQIGNNPDNDDIKAFDFGINALAGYQFTNGLFLSAGYNGGLSNLQPGNPNEDGKVKSHYFSIKLGYIFGGTK